MDTSEKIKVFKTFESLTQEIVKDKDAKDLPSQRYAVRFIMLNNFNMFKDLAKFMSNIGVNSLDLENLIDNEDCDAWITKDMLKDAIKSCKDSTFVTPFSELARFYNDDDFRGFFNEIMLTEDIRNPKKRVYMPLIGLQNRFTDFLNHFARIRESAPVWRYDTEAQSVEVFLTAYKNFSLPCNEHQCQLNSLRDWLKFWKAQAPQKRIICTSRPISIKFKYSKPDNIFNFKKIVNAYEFMIKFLDMSFPFDFQEEENCYWEKLLSIIDKKNTASFSFDSFVRKHFNRVDYDAKDVLEDWTNISSNAFDRWLLKNYVIHTQFHEHYPYMTMCMEDIATFNDIAILPSNVATRILYDVPINQRTSFAEERRNIIINNKHIFQSTITQETQNWIFERIKEIFQQKKDLNAAIELCTGSFDFECLLLMGWYVHCSDKKLLEETIKHYYTDFSAYLTTIEPTHIRKENKWCVDYCNKYKSAKLQDRYTDDISQYIKELNNSASSFYKWYFEFDSSHNLLADISRDIPYRPDKIYWIDGLGIEFLSYLHYLIDQEQSNFKIIRSQITRSELPSSTTHNRFEGDNVEKFGALDELGHDSHMYKPLVTLHEELKVLKNIVHGIVCNNKNTPCTIAIVSDHGLSCLSRKVPSKKYDGDFEHEGRYIKILSNAEHDTDFLVHKNENDKQTYKVALTHSSLSKVPTHQVHGGCTPEEVLVPFIVLSNKNVSTSVKYKISLSSLEILLSNPVVTLIIMPEPHNVSLTYEGTEYIMDRIGTQWTCVLQNVTEGQHSITVKPEGAVSQELKINIIGIGGDTNINDIMDI